jgi:hypothetical protein
MSPMIRSLFSCYGSSTNSVISEVWWSRKCGVSLVDPLNTKEAVFPIGAVQDFIVGGPNN